MKSIILGKGDWGKLLEKYIRQDSRFEILEIFGKDFSVLKIPKGTQVAFIATPLKSHFNLALECLKSGIHVFVEKPTCESLEEFYRLKQESQKNAVRFYTDYIYLTSPSILKIKESLSCLCGGIEIKASIKQYGKFYAGESALDVLGVHFLSVFADWFGKLKVVRRHNVRAYEESFVLNANGISIDFCCSLVSQIKERRIHIVAKNGEIFFDMLAKNTVRMLIGNKEKIFSFDEKNNIANSLQKFYEILNDEQKYLEHCHLSKEITRVMEECKR